MAPATLSLLGQPLPANEAAERLLPPSSQRILQLLRERGAMTHGQVAENTAMPRRTIRFAVRRLRDENLVSSVPCLRDCRSSYLFANRAGAAIEAPAGQHAPFVRAAAPPNNAPQDDAKAPDAEAGERPESFAIALA